jgi:hypothetical protein
MESQGRDPRRERVRLFEMMALVGGIAFALWVFSGLLKEAWEQGGNNPEPFFTKWDNAGYYTLVAILGGMSLVGVPLLIVERWRLSPPRRPWRDGRFLWFSHGLASWLLWPPTVYHMASGSTPPTGSMSAMCYFYGTPLMAVYVTLALLTGGRLRRAGRMARRSWRERFGLILALVWACTGLYFLACLYTREFRR